MERSRHDGPAQKNKCSGCEMYENYVRPNLLPCLQIKMSYPFPLSDLQKSQIDYAQCKGSTLLVEVYIVLSFQKAIRQQMKEC